jgi:Fur family zinc uptake transcriptional regulator
MARDAGQLNDTQRRVHEALSEAGKPLSAYEILDRLRGAKSVTPPTVYRSLERLIELGLAHRIESLNAFTACRHDHAEHPAAFAICDGCGSVTEFHDDGLDRRLDRWSREHGFRASRTMVEIRGLCGTCAA